MRKADKIILIITLLILFISILALFSSCHLKGEFVRKDIFYKQLSWIALGLIGMFLFYRIDFRVLRDVAWPLYFIVLFLLLVVLVFGHIRLGAQRWLSMGGFNLQPSELGKVALILALSRYFSQKTFEELKEFKKRISLLRGFLLPLVVTLLYAFLVAIQPDLGTAIVYGLIFMSLVYFCGVRFSYIASFVTLIAILSPLSWLFLHDYQKNRLLVFLDPNRDPLGAGYTIIQSKIAIGSGRIFGKGWLSGTQNQLNFLTERHTDFIFSTLGEEWGFLGSLVLILLFYLLVKRILRISNITHDPFAKNLCLSIASLVMIQFFINIAMTIGIMPVVGLPLPFLSYGGSSLVMFLILIGIVLNISEQK